MRNKIIEKTGFVLLIGFFVFVITNCSLSGRREHEDKHDIAKKIGKKMIEGDFDHRESEDFVTISTDAVKLVGIVIDSVTLNRIDKKIIFPGEIGFNEERLHRVIPRFPGIVKSINKRIGDKVLKGEILTKIQSNESLSVYSIFSKVSGIVIKRDLTFGEFTGEGKAVFVIADISSVWVNINVFPKDIKQLKIGMKVIASPLDGERKAVSRITNIIPVISRKTRCMTARTFLMNVDNYWYPGMFVNCEVIITSPSKVPTVFSESIQIIDDEPVIFVPVKNNEFHIVHIVKGENNGTFTEILKGLQLGDKYVRKGAFELKANIITSKMSGHAGHGH